MEDLLTKRSDLSQEVCKVFSRQVLLVLVSVTE
jgi:hypothetical protein